MLLGNKQNATLLPEMIHHHKLSSGFFLYFSLLVRQFAVSPFVDLVGYGEHAKRSVTLLLIVHS